MYATTVTPPARSSHRPATYLVCASGISALVQRGRQNIGVAAVERISMAGAELRGDCGLQPGDEVTLFLRVSGKLPLKATAQVTDCTDAQVTIAFVEIEPAMRDIINRLLLADLSAQFRGARDALRVR